MLTELSQKLKNAPEQAGIYQFFDEKGMLLYVGKAKNIKNRVKSYFRFSGSLSPSALLSPRIHKMIYEVVRVEFIVVQSEHDALILENSLIKQLKPKYNILLRDDKTYPYIAIDMSAPFPRFEITRKVINDKNIRYFGPLSGSAKAILEGIYLCFQLVQKRGCLKEKKACLFHQIERCPAPCEQKISRTDYLKQVKNALEALHDHKKLTSLLQTRMEQASTKLNFEEAAKLRDIIRSIQESMHTTHVELLKLENYDVFAIECLDKKAIVMRLFIRDGKIVSTTHSILQSIHGFEKDELYQRAIFEFYHPMNQTFAKHILVADMFEEKENLEGFLSDKFGQSITISLPKKGEKVHLISIAKQNAQHIMLHQLSNTHDTLMKQLHVLFDFKVLPKRIEIFDNSHLGGVAPVGAMVVWDEKFQKSSYRKYHLQAHDEYGQMKEMLQRRINDFQREPAPDVWVLDGGDTLLKLAHELLLQAHIQIELLAIAKEKRDAKANRSKGKALDTLYTINQTFQLPAHDKRLQFIQKLRDEAHRFAITFHRSTKQRTDLKSELEKVEGIGPATIKKLLNYFGSFEGIYNATEEELEITIGKKITTNMINSLKK